ncbi:hypothetical protein ACFT25_40480 [Streptomyces hydrogenans]|uniref:hypothetical protein n=1 Tax=Streptomyces hydrogenans TaxID=1873719 RepID=UPI003625727D
MRMVRARLTGRPGAEPPAVGAGLIHDLLWAHASPADGLEHIRVRSLPHGMDVVLFLAAGSDEAALRSADVLMERFRGPLSRHGLTGHIVR